MFFFNRANIVSMNEIRRTGVKSFDHELENESFDCFSKEERKKLDKEFTLKIWTKYSLYSWLLFLGVLAITAIILIVCLVVDSPYRFFTFLLAPGYIPLFIFLINILKTTKAKYRYFLFINQKLRDEGFNDFYFRSYMVTLCYRLIIKDLLKKYHLESNYKFLMDNFSNHEKISKYVTEEALKDFLGDAAKDAEIEILK